MAQTYHLFLYNLTGAEILDNGWGTTLSASSNSISIEVTSTGLNIYDGQISKEEAATANPIQVLNYDIPGLAGFTFVFDRSSGAMKCYVGDIYYTNSDYNSSLHIYAFPEEKPNSITDLTNTTWYFKESLEHCWIAQYAPDHISGCAYYQAEFKLDLVMNDVQYSGLGFGLKGEGDRLDDDGVSYWSDDAYVDAYYYGWEDESYRTITITGGEDVTNPDLITWITTNAVQTNISKPDSPETDSTGHYLLFSSPEEFTLEAHASFDNGMPGGMGAEGWEKSLGGWNGTMEYSTDAAQWEVWDGTTILSSVNGKLYVRGTNNTKISGFVYAEDDSGGTNYYWVLTGSEVSCIGNVETLLDYKTVANGQHPPMADWAFENWWWDNSALVTTPSFGAITLTEGCYYMAFGYCSNLRTIPELPATTLPNACYVQMFCGCENIRLSTEQTDEYKYEYRIPSSGSGIETDEYSTPAAGMFEGTGGTFTGTPELNTVYYTSNEIVRAVQPEENKPTCTFDLTTLGLPSGSYTIYVKLSAEGYKDSEASNEVTWEKVETVYLIPKNTSLCYNLNDGSGEVWLGEGDPFPSPLPTTGYTNFLDGDHPNDSGSGDIHYGYVAETNTWHLDGTDDPCMITEVNVRDTICGLPVTTIATRAFLDMSGEWDDDFPSIWTELLRIPKSITCIESEAFYGCTKIKDIIYDGTMAEWNNINFEDGWNYRCSAITVTCTDGIINIPSTR